VRLEKEFRNIFENTWKDVAQLVFIHRLHTIEDYFKYKDKRANLKRCNVGYERQCSCCHS